MIDTVLVERICSYCESSFNTEFSFQKFCSISCQEKDRYTRKRNPIAKGQLQSLICPMCNRSFETTRSDQKYCSVECRSKKKSNGDTLAPGTVRDTAHYSHCVICEVSLEGNKRRKFCSQKCKNASTMQTYREKHGIQKETEKTIRCKFCKNTFTTKKNDKLYCSNRCADQEHEKTRRENRNAERPLFTPKISELDGYIFRSQGEKELYLQFQEHGVACLYEAQVFELPSGSFYTPDFYLPQYDIYIEYKGAWFLKSSSVKFNESKQRSRQKIKEFVKYCGKRLYLLMQGREPQFFKKFEKMLNVVHSSE